MQSLTLMIRFLTRYPLPGPDPAFTPENFIAGMKWAPLAGLLIGLPAALVHLVAMHLLNTEIASALAVVALIHMGGGLHLDGLADTADGLAANGPPEKALAVMRDSAAGTGGVIALILDILLKWLLLANLLPGTALAALLAAPAMGRMALVWHAAAGNYARNEPGLGAFVNRVGYAQALAATLVALLALLPTCRLLYMSLFQTLVLFFVIPAGAALLGVNFARHLGRRIGGVTGDTLGATSELAELLTLLIFAFFSLYGYNLL